MKDLLAQEALDIIEKAYDEPLFHPSVSDVMNTGLYVGLLKESQMLYIAFNTLGDVAFSFNSFDYIAMREDSTTFYKYVLRVTCIERELNYEVVAIRGDSEGWF